MGPSSFQKVSEFFSNLAGLADARQELSRYDQIIQFHILGEGPFLIRVSHGEVSSELGEVKNPDFLKVLTVKTDADTITELLERRRTLGEALFQGKVDIYGNIVKEYIIAWLSNFFRMTGLKNP